MMKERIRSNRGISLISLTITVVVILILTNIVIYNLTDSLQIGKLKKMQNDISNLRDKIDSYYAQSGKIPANIKYTNIDHIKSAGVISTVADTGDFLVIDLSALENLTLNYGKDFEEVKKFPEKANDYKDIYIINEDSHNIFYVAGINVDNDIYYTNYTSENIDTAPVNLRYVENVKIPSGYSYVKGNKETGIIIKNDEDNKEYKWIVVNNVINQIPEGITVDNEEKFLDSVNRFDGYFKSDDNTVIYIEVTESWSPTYDKDGTYKDKNGDIAYIPQGFQVSEKPGENTVDDGLVVKDGNNNEWVWIEVPRAIYTTATSNTDYANIEKDMQKYANGYRESGYTDIWYSADQHGFASSSDYNNYKNNMLKSVYENGGFYIGRYETGTQTARFAGTNDSGLTTPIIKQDVYPYNFVTCKQAQTLSNQLSTAEKTSSLMFGIQWDLVMKFIEEKGNLADGTKVTQNMLKTDSSDWGNYINKLFDITRGQYTTSPETSASWKTVTSSYTKNLFSILLTTGATDRNSALNVYDLAGNVCEWTLENFANTNPTCSARGGSCYDYGIDNPASYRAYIGVTDVGYRNGFRSALY